MMLDPLLARAAGGSGEEPTQLGLQGRAPANPSEKCFFSPVTCSQNGVQRSKLSNVAALYQTAV